LFPAVSVYRHAAERRNSTSPLVTAPVYVTFQSQASQFPQQPENSVQRTGI
jgi:hypothetical protein